MSRARSSATLLLNNHLGARPCSGPETFVYRPRLLLHVRPADLDLVVAATEDLATRDREDRVRRVLTRDVAQILLPQCEHDSPDVPPEDRSRTHRARLSARVERAAPRELGVEALACHAHHIGLGVSGAVTLSDDGVLALDHDLAVGVHQERPKGMVPVVPRLLGELDGRKQITVVIRHQLIQTPWVRRRAIADLGPLVVRAKLAQRSKRWAGLVGANQPLVSVDPLRLEASSSITCA